MATLVIFRNNISHNRYNEARVHLANVKNGLRDVLALVVGSGRDVKDPQRLQVHRAEARVIATHLLVGGGPAGFGAGLRVRASTCSL